MEELPKPSGIAIPLFLKRKWERQQQEQQSEDQNPSDEEDDDKNTETKDDDTSNNNTSGDRENENTSHAPWEPKLRLSLDQELTRDERNELSNRVFTTSELEERIMKTTAAMFDIQRQLYRGEEIYYEDTYSHGSIYKGWDAFVDSASATGSGGTQMSSNRRVPVDSRWFSSSCESVSRTKPPTNFPPPLISQPVLSAAKLTSIPEQQQDGKSTKATSQPLDSVSNTAATNANETESNSETAQPTSSRIRQRIAASAASNSEKGDADGNSSAPKSSSRPGTPTTSGRSVDSSSTKKKRKATATPTNEEPPSKKGNQKSSSDEAKRQKTGDATKAATTVAGGTKSTKSEKKDGASTPGAKSNKAEKSTPGKREKDAETPVPRKRGRPRRKSLN